MEFSYIIDFYFLFKLCHYLLYNIMFDNTIIIIIIIKTIQCMYLSIIKLLM